MYLYICCAVCMYVSEACLIHMYISHTYIQVSAVVHWPGGTPFSFSTWRQENPPISMRELQRIRCLLADFIASHVGMKLGSVCGE